MFKSLAQNIADAAAKISFDSLVWFAWGSFAAIFILALTLCLSLPSVRSSSKRPYLCLVYAYTATTFALFLTAFSMEQAAFIACIFWIVGYVSYGVLCALSGKKKRGPRTLPAQVAACAAPAAPMQNVPVQIVQPQPVQQPTPPPKASKPASGSNPARNNVRLDHAIAVTNRLLQKNLGKTDRQELEKLKNTLEVMKVKGTLTPAEGEILNENFNTLLKLMAKYNV